MEIVGLIIATLAGALYLAALVYAVVRIVRTDQLTGIERFVWLLVVIAFPLAGPIVWYVLGPHPLGLRVVRNDR